MERVSARGALAVVAVGFFVLFFGTVAGARLQTNPANNKHLVDKPLEPFNYDYAKRCLDHPPSGMLAFEHWLEHNVRGETWGIMRCERLSGDNFSLHAEGRAIDWHLDARNAGEKNAAMNLIHTLLEKDRNGQPAALARRMGVQGIIFNCQAWWSGQSGLGHYSYCYNENGHRRHGLDPTQAHINHVHLELNWPGARERTSFWHSPLA
jgi:hypothetical protein